jgi:hypothetical protein
VENQKSAAQIAREIRCSRATVIEHLHEFDIPIRDTPAHRQRRGQIPYGMKMRNGKLVEQKGEQEIIEKLRIMRSEGKTYRELVVWLKFHNVKTKNRKSQWDRPTIYKILRRTNADH